MTDKAFLPEWSVTSYGVTYRGLYRLFAGDDWRMVRENKKPVCFDTASQALAAAEAHLKRVLNPPIRSEKIAADHADDLGYAEWRQKKAQEAAQERVQAFGASVFAKGRVIPVERKRRRA